MSLNDPIADMLTRIRNACAANHRRVDMPVSTIKSQIARILKENHFITDFRTVETEDGKPMVESIDADGNYIANAGTEHADHGTAVMKDGKACFTSAMNDEGEVCWTNPNLEVGQSGETTSDKGEKLTVKRIEYVALTM